MNSSGGYVDFSVVDIASGKKRTLSNCNSGIHRRIVPFQAYGILKYFLIGTTQWMPLLQIAQYLICHKLEQEQGLEFS